jgi:hypothetical protein
MIFRKRLARGPIVFVVLTFAVFAADTSGRILD